MKWNPHQFTDDKPQKEGRCLVYTKEETRKYWIVSFYDFGKTRFNLPSSAVTVCWYDLPPDNGALLHGNPLKRGKYLAKIKKGRDLFRWEVCYFGDEKRFIVIGEVLGWLPCRPNQ